MKLSVSLPVEDVEFLDAYAKSQGYESRSAVVRKAVLLLRAGELSGAYEDAWQSWSSEDAEAWDAAVADGLDSE
jgi:Arc/MetJ-type ribon-helix-helix transcriptional regulator